MRSGRGDASLVKVRNLFLQLHFSVVAIRAGAGFPGGAAGPGPAVPVHYPPVPRPLPGGSTAGAQRLLRAPGWAGRGRSALRGCRRGPMGARCPHPGPSRSRETGSVGAAAGLDQAPRRRKRNLEPAGRGGREGHPDAGAAPRDRVSPPTRGAHCTLARSPPRETLRVRSHLRPPSSPPAARCRPSGHGALGPPCPPPLDPRRRVRNSPPVAPPSDSAPPAPGRRLGPLRAGDRSGRGLGSRQAWGACGSPGSPDPGRA